jgi:hypothetical protein
VLAGLAAVFADAQQPAPHIDTIDAPLPQAGATITLTGTNFGADQGILWIANGPATITSWSDTNIVATIPLTAISGPIWVARKDKPWVWSDGLQSIELPTPPVSSSAITVHDVAVYDNVLLQQMLDADRSRLTGMQFLNQSQVAGNIGTIQGASMQQSGLSVSISGPQMPGVSSVLNSGSAQTTQSQGTSTQNTGATTLTVTNTSGSSPAGTPPSSELSVTAPTSSTTLTGNNQTQLTGPSTQTTYTLAQPPSPIPAAAPMTTFTPPSSFSPSASNILNEEVQLNSEVAGLALMMEGPLTDQIYPVRLPDGANTFVQKHHLTLGIPITITPRDDDKGSVAEIVLNVIPIDNLSPQDGPPAITAILPEDKTYNAATISSKSVNIGGGIVTGILTAGVNWLWQRQTYYVVQAQDTVAFQLPPDPNHPDTISFGWDLRPVLGNPTVLAGNRTLFVQLAFTTPSKPSSKIPVFGFVSVATRWKKIDKKLNIVSDEAFDEAAVPKLFSIRNLNASPDVQDVSDPVDNGDGTVTVHVESDYYPNSTYIKIGNSVIAQGAPNAAFFPHYIDFTAPASLLATQQASLVDRTGNSSSLVSAAVADVNSILRCLTISNSAVSAESATTAKVNATLALASGQCTDALKTATYTTPRLSDLPLVAVIGSKVFGYRDAPVAFDVVDDHHETISFHAPTDLIRNSPWLTVKRLFWGDPFKGIAHLDILPIPTIDKATVVKKSKDNLEIALIGSNLKQLHAPAGMAFQQDGKTCTDPLPSFADTDTGRILCVSGKLLSTLSQAALSSSSGDLLLVALPNPAKPKATGPTLQPQGYLDAGVATNLSVNGTKLDTFDHVEIEKKTVPAELAADKKSILVHLSADLVKAPKIVLVFIFKGSPNVSYTVNVNKKGA